MVTKQMYYEICQRSTHDGYIALGINNNFNMVGAEIIGEFSCSDVGDRLVTNTTATKLTNDFSSNHIEIVIDPKCNVSVMR